MAAPTACATCSGVVSLVRNHLVNLQRNPWSACSRMGWSTSPESPYIEGSRWGGQCTVGIAVHPKQIDRNSGGKINLSKLKTYDYEFKLSLWDYARGERWDYSDNVEDNFKTLNEIIDLIKKKAIPTFNLFEANPNILDEFKASDLDNFHEIFTKKTGVSIATTEIRFAWALTVFFENSNLLKAKQFAEYGYSKLSKGDKFFGKSDFQKVLGENNGA